MKTSEMKKEKWIYFPIETKAREFEARLLLTVFALKKGYRVVLGQHYLLSKYLEQFTPGIYFFKDLAFYKNKLFTEIKKLKFKLVTLEEEALVAADNPIPYANEKFSEENLELVDKVICWGEFDYRAMFPKYLKYKNKFAKLGNPRLDVWSPQVNSLFDEEVSRLKAKFGTFILIPSNFAYRSHINGKDFGIQFREINRMNRTEMAREQTIRFHEYMDRGMDTFLELIPRLAEEYKDVTFIIRNHPSEDPKLWNEMAEQHKNITVEYEGTITPYILASECILHFGCTSGLESYLLQTPSIIYCPEENQEFQETVSYELSTMHRGYDSLTADIDNVLNNDFVKSNSADTYFHNNFYNGGEVLAAEKIIDLIDNDVFSFTENSSHDFGFIKKEIKKRQLRSRVKHNFLLSPLSLLYDCVRNKLGLASPVAISVVKGTQKWPGLTQSEIEERLKKISQILNIDLNVKCENICEEIFILKNAE